MKDMEPDDYNLSSAKPVTALAAWMTIANIRRNDLASDSNVSNPTVTAARQGSVTRSSAALLSMSTGLPAETIAKGQAAIHWRFRLSADRTVEVLP